MWLLCGKHIALEWSGAAFAISHHPVQLFAFRVAGGRPTRVGRGAFGGLFSRLPLKRATDAETNTPVMHRSSLAY